MEASDKRMDYVRSLLAESLRVDEDKWREFATVKKNLLLLNTLFNNREPVNLFLWINEESSMSVSLDFPAIRDKVVCVTKTEPEPITVDNFSKVLLIEDVHGEDVLSFISALTQEVVCPLLSNPANNGDWPPGAAEETLNIMERLKNEALVMKARQEGWTFLPLPKNLHDIKQRKSRDVKLLHACESVIIEWAGLVSEFLQQNPSQPLLDGLKPQPSEEFHFWNNRLKNLQLIQQQMSSSKAQQVASFLQSAEGAYCFILKQISEDVQKGLLEAQDATQKLQPLQEKLEQIEHLQYRQLRDKMSTVMEKVTQVWLNSHFHCKPRWIVVLLEEICNLFIDWSRKFLRGQDVMQGLLADPAQVLDDIRVVILTLQSLKDMYNQYRTHLEKQNGISRRWEFPSQLVFSQVDDFLTRLLSIQEVYSVRLQFQLEQVVLAGGRGNMWTGAVEEVYQDFLQQLHLLTDCQYDASEPTDQSFPLKACSFQDHVLDLESRLVSILRGTLEDCCMSLSAVKILNMFGPVLERPLIQEQLRPQLVRLVDMVMTELDQVEALVQRKSLKTELSSKFRASPAATLRWTQQLLLRAHNVLLNFQTVQYLCGDSGELVVQKFQKIVALVVKLRNLVRLDWSCQLDMDSTSILEHPLIEQQEGSMLEIPFRDKLEAMLSDIKQVSWEKDLELHPEAAQGLSVRWWVKLCQWSFL